MKKINLLLLFLIGTAILSCKESSKNCSDSIACTFELRTILVEVLDSDGNRVVFDEFTVTNLDTNEVIDLGWEQGDLYPIASDTMFGDIPMDGHRFELVGFINGEEVIREIYLVGHDCCHIVLLEGETTMQL